MGHALRIRGIRMRGEVHHEIVECGEFGVWLVLEVEPSVGRGVDEAVPHNSATALALLYHSDRVRVGGGLAAAHHKAAVGRAPQELACFVKGEMELHPLPMLCARAQLGARGLRNISHQNFSKQGLFTLTAEVDGDVVCEPPGDLAAGEAAMAGLVLGLMLSDCDLTLQKTRSDACMI